MKRIAVILTLGILLTVLVSLSGCVHTDTAVTNQKEYKIAVTGGTPVFNHLNKNGKLEGFETDLINSIAKEAGIKIKCEVTSRAARIPALKAGQVDVILAVMTITEERRKVVDFSDPYYEATIYMLVPANSLIKSLDDLRGKTVACAMATTGDIAVSQFLGKNYEGIKRFKETSTGFMELTNGKVDAAVGDCAIVLNYVKNNPEDNLKIIKDSKFPKQYYGMAVRKGDKETLHKLNTGLRKIRENGTYDQIRRKWFSE